MLMHEDADFLEALSRQRQRRNFTTNRYGNSREAQRCKRLIKGMPKVRHTISRPKQLTQTHHELLEETTGRNGITKG